MMMETTGRTEALRTDMDARRSSALALSNRTSPRLPVPGTGKVRKCSRNALRSSDENGWRANAHSLATTLVGRLRANLVGRCCIRRAATLYQQPSIILPNKAFRRRLISNTNTSTSHQPGKIRTRSIRAEWLPKNQLKFVVVSVPNSITILNLNAVIKCREGPGATRSWHSREQLHLLIIFTYKLTNPFIIATKYIEHTARHIAVVA